MNHLPLAAWRMRDCYATPSPFFGGVSSGREMQTLFGPGVVSRLCAFTWGPAIPESLSLQRFSINGPAFFVVRVNPFSDGPIA